MSRTNMEYNNISDSVNFILKSARKRRMLAMRTARELNAEAGLKTKVVLLSKTGTK